MNDQRKNVDVFISCASADLAFAGNLRDQLTERNLNAFLYTAPGRIQPGESFPSVLAKAIEESAIVVAFLSAHALQSKWVPREIFYADMHDKKVVPIELDSNWRPLGLDLKQDAANIQTPLTQEEHERTRFYKIIVSSSQMLTTSDGRLNEKDLEYLAQLSRMNSRLAEFEEDLPIPGDRTKELWKCIDSEGIVVAQQDCEFKVERKGPLSLATLRESLCANRVLCIIGPKLAGKTILVEQLTHCIHGATTEIMSVRLTPDTIADVERVALEPGWAVNERGNVVGDDRYVSPNRPEFRKEYIFADWAIQFVARVAHKAMKDDDQYNRFFSSGTPEARELASYMYNRHTVVRDLIFRRERQPSRSLLEAFRSSILGILQRAKLPTKDCVLVITVDDLDRYLQYQHIGLRMVQSFLEAVGDETVHQLAGGDIAQDAMKLHVIVTSQYLYTPNTPQFYWINNEGKSPVFELLPFSEDECLVALNSSQSCGFSSEEAIAVGKRAFSETNGYPRFFNRFVKAVSMLRRYKKSLPFEKVLDLVSNSSVFWYFDMSVLDANFTKYVHQSLASSPFPDTGSEKSDFLRNVHQMFGRSSETLELYEAKFGDEVNEPTVVDKDSSSVSSYLMPLRNAGLIQQFRRYRYNELRSIPPVPSNGRGGGQKTSTGTGGIDRALN